MYNVHLSAIVLIGLSVVAELKQITKYLLQLGKVMSVGFEVVG